MRIHLGHHFYGAGNVGDDFMLAGFLEAMRALEPHGQFTACVPFALDPLRLRFPEVDWKPYTNEARDAAIAQSDVWLGLGGSPFQSAQSRWFIEHLLGDAARCARLGKPMYYLGIGVQTEAEVRVSEVGALCAQALAIWTRDAASAERIGALRTSTAVRSASDIAHVFFRRSAVPAAVDGRVSLVANFDYQQWPGCNACLEAIDLLQPAERVWLAQESRELPGGERTLFAALAPSDRSKWRLTIADSPSARSTAERRGGPISEILHNWPSAEWLISSRFHAVLAGAWAGSKIVVIAVNEKLAEVARELGTPTISPDASLAEVRRSLGDSHAIAKPVKQAEQAFTACAEFVRLARRC